MLGRRGDPSCMLAVLAFKRRLPSTSANDIAQTVTQGLQAAAGLTVHIVDFHQSVTSAVHSDWHAVQHQARERADRQARRSTSAGCARY